MEINSPKTLIVVAHPHIADSTTQQFLQAAVHQTSAIWHHIDGLNSLDVQQERQLLAAADRIIFQFPLYWYAAPASLKKWQEQVLSTNFIQQQLAHKQLGLVVTTGLPQKAFQTGGSASFTLDQLLAPFYAFGQQAQMQCLPKFAIYQFSYLTERQHHQLFMDYQRYLTQPSPDNLLNRSNWYLNYLQQHPQLPQQALLIDYLTQQILTLDNLQTTWNLIKEAEDDRLDI